MNNIVIPTLWVLTGISAYAAVNHWLIGARRPFNALHLLFAGMCLSMPLFSATNSLVIQAANIPDYLAMLRLNLSSVMVFLILLPWFIAEYTGVRPIPLLITFNVLFVAFFVVNLLQPYTLQYAEIQDLYRLRLPWGEDVTRVTGINSAWFKAGTLTLTILYAFVLYSLSALYRRGRQKPALVMILAMGLFMIASVEGILVRFSVIQFIELAPLAYPIIILVMSMVLNHEIRQGGLRLQAILDHVPAVVYVKDANGRYLMINRQYENLFHVTNKAIIGRTDYDVFPETQADTFRANDQMVVATGSVIESEEIAGQNGEPHIYSSIKFPLYHREGTPSAVCGISTDITGRKLAEESLARSEVKHRMLFEHANDAIFLMQGERFIECNEKTLAMFGCRRADIIGNTPMAFSPPLQPDGQASSLKAQEIIQAAYRGHAQVFEWQHTRLNGQPFDAEVSLNVFDTLGESWLLAIVRDITDRKTAEAQVEFLAYHDALTGLPNRLSVQDHFKMAGSYADRANTNIAVIFLDLDNFKTINDSLGHTIGDALLKATARRLRECVRDTDTLSRQGGDEFLILLTDVPDPEEVISTVEKLLRRLAAPFDVDGHHLPTSLSVGIAVYPDDGRDFDTLLKKADTAMYKAKEAGRNTYRFYTEQMNVDAIESLRMRNGLQQALERGEFVLHYQPQIDLATGAVIGAEALIRWNHPVLGMVPPSRFIPVAEECGLIVQIGDWVLLETCQQAAAWRQAGLPEMVVAVNISAVQFKHHNLENSVVQALVDSGLDPACLELELTESILIHDAATVLASVQRLKALGVKLSVDDFGTGYSSLSYLKRFNVDKLKIDQSFIYGMADDPNDAAIVRAIIQMARSLNLKTTAEGVEDERLLTLLRLQHCDEAQGYFFARPMPSDEFVQYVMSQTR